jgi:hypothetical protein
MAKIRNFLNRLKAIFQGADYFDEEVTKQPAQSQILRAKELQGKEPFDVFHGVKRPDLELDNDVDHPDSSDYVPFPDRYSKKLLSDPRYKGLLDVYKLSLDTQFRKLIAAHWKKEEKECALVEAGLWDFDENEEYFKEHTPAEKLFYKNKELVVRFIASEELLINRSRFLLAGIEDYILSPNGEDFIQEFCDQSNEEIAKMWFYKSKKEATHS